MAAHLDRVRDAELGVGGELLVVHEDRRVAVGQQLGAAEEHLLVDGVLVLRHRHVEHAVVVEVGEDQRVGAGGRRGEGEGVLLEGAVLVLEQAVRVGLAGLERAGDEVGAAVGVVVEEGAHVVEAGGVLELGPHDVGLVDEGAVGVIDEDAVAAAGAVAQGDEVEEAVLVEVDRLDIEGADALWHVVEGDVGELAAAVVGEQPDAVLRAREAGDGDVEVKVVVDVDELEVPGPADLVERHVVEGHVLEHGGADLVEAAGVADLLPQEGGAALGERRVADRRLRAPVGEDHVEVAVAVDVAELEVTDAGVARREVEVRLIGEAADAVVDEDLARLLPGDAEDDVVVAVAVDIPRRDRAAVEAGTDPEHLAAHVGHSEAGVVEERLLRRVGAGITLVVAAAVGEHEVDPAVAVEVGGVDHARAELRALHEEVSVLDPRLGAGGQWQ